jgi:hypothetical protein
MVLQRDLLERRPTWCSPDAARQQHLGGRGAGGGSGEVRRGGGPDRCPLVAELDDPLGRGRRPDVQEVVDADLCGDRLLARRAVAGQPELVAQEGPPQPQQLEVACADRLRRPVALVGRRGAQERRPAERGRPPGCRRPRRDQRPCVHASALTAR